jgi:hypothetical protein
MKFSRIWYEMIPDPQHWDPDLHPVFSQNFSTFVEVDADATCELCCSVELNDFYSDHKFFGFGYGLCEHF